MPAWVGAPAHRSSPGMSGHSTLAAARSPGPWPDPGRHRAEHLTIDLRRSATDSGRVMQLPTGEGQRCNRTEGVPATRTPTRFTDAITYRAGGLEASRSALVRRWQRACMATNRIAGQVAHYRLQQKAGGSRPGGPKREPPTLVVDRSSGRALARLRLLQRVDPQGLGKVQACLVGDGRVSGPG